MSFILFLNLITSVFLLFNNEIRYTRHEPTWPTQQMFLKRKRRRNTKINCKFSLVYSLAFNIVCLLSVIFRLKSHQILIYWFNVNFIVIRWFKASYSPVDPEWNQASHALKFTPARLDLSQFPLRKCSH